MRAFAATIILLTVCSLCYAETVEPLPELIVTIDEVGYIRSSPSEDSVIVSVYVENVVDAIGGIDLWIAINHNNVVQYMSDSVWQCDTVYFNCQDSVCIEWDGDVCLAWEYFDCEDTLINCSWVELGAVRLDGTMLEDWNTVDVNVYGSQRMLLQIWGLAITAPPIPPGQGAHLLVRLAFEVSDKTGYLLDSLCNDSDFYDEYGVTEIWVEQNSMFSDETGSGLIGWYWNKFCVDSICTEWIEDSCITWECTEWDSVYTLDTSKVHYDNGWITLICDCDALIGDANGSGAVDIDDVVYLIVFIFQGGPDPVPYSVASGDANCSGVVDVDDVVYLIELIFSSGPAPCTCEEWVGIFGALW